MNPPFDYESLSREERIRRIGAILGKTVTLRLERERAAIEQAGRVATESDETAPSSHSLLRRKAPPPPPPPPPTLPFGQPALPFAARVPVGNTLSGIANDVVMERTAAEFGPALGLDLADLYALVAAARSRTELRALITAKLASDPPRHAQETLAQASFAAAVNALGDRS